MIAFAVVLLVTVVTALLFDLGLKIAGYPAQMPVRITLPANFKQDVENIEFEYSFKTNSQGLRYKEVPLQKPEGTKRVFVVGDSFTVGFGVAAEDAFPSLLEQRYATAKLDFVNGGMEGQGPQQYARLWSHVGVRYEPDGLIIAIYQNDLSDMPEALDENSFKVTQPVLTDTTTEKLLYRFLPRTYVMLKMVKRRMKESERLSVGADFVARVVAEAEREQVTQSRIDAWRNALPAHLVEAAEAGAFNGWVFSFGLLQPHFFSDAIDVATPRAENKWRSMVFALKNMLVVARENGVQTAIVYLPAPLQHDKRVYAADSILHLAGYELDKRWLAGQSEFQSRLARWCDHNDVPFLDLTETFRAASDEQLNWPLDGHWTQAGHALASGAIYQWLQGGQVFDFVPALESAGKVASDTR